MGWPNNYVQGVYNSDNELVGLDGSALFGFEAPLLSYTFKEALGIQQQPVMNDVVLSVPTVLSGTNYYIDPSNGSASDAGAGTSVTAPWVEFKNIALKTFGVGDTINIANDSTFNYSQTLTAYNATPHFTYLSADNFICNDKNNPIKIKPYYPRGYSTTKPIIRWYADVAVGDWTNESGIDANVWSCPVTGAGYDCLLFTGTSNTTHRYNRGAAGNAAILASVPTGGTYVCYGNKLYMYSVGNPTTAYGTVKVSAKAMLRTYNLGLSNTVISGLQFELVSLIGIDCNATTVTGNTVNVEVKDCSFIKAKVGTVRNQCAYTLPLEIGVSVHDNYFEDCPGLGLHLPPTTGTAGNSTRWEVYRNRMIRGNLQASDGALLYNQCVGGTKHIAWGNYGYEIVSEPNTGSDGSFIYNELGSENSIVHGNIVEKSHKAFNVNSAKNCHVVSNLAIDCWQLMTNTNASSTVGIKNIVANNTYLWTGRITKSDLNKSGLSDTAPFIDEWNDGGAVTKLSNYAVVNNLAIDLSGGTRQFIRYISAHITTNLISGNAAIGLTGILTSDDGTDTSGTSAIGFRGSVSDVASIFPYASEGRLTQSVDQTNPLIDTGVSISTQYPDITGNKFSLIPNAGCISLVKNEKTAEWVKNAIADDIKLKSEVEIYSSGAAYAVTGITAGVTVDTFIIPKYSMGKNGYLRIDVDLVCAANNANVKTVNIIIGGFTVAAYALASTDGLKASFKIRNSNSYANQHRTSTFSNSFGATNFTTVNVLNTETDLTATIQVVLAAADTVTRLGVSAYTKYTK